MREIVFISAGSEDGLGLGDTVAIVGDDGSLVTEAVVVALAARQSNVRPLLPGAQLRAGLLVRLHGSAAVTTASAPAAQAARQDTARITYRTRELVFFAAGREHGVAVGDTVQVLDAAGTPVTSAVVASTAQRSASGRLTDTDADVALTGRVVYTSHPQEPVAVLSLSQPIDSTAQAAPASPYPIAPAQQAGRGISGGIHLDQFGSSSGGSFTSSQTALGLTLDVPLDDAVAFRVRTTSRYRSTTGGLVPGGVTTIPYQLELQLGRPTARVRASLGRFLAADAYALGYLDGVRLEARPTSHQRLGIAAGLVPDPVLLHFRTTVQRVGAWWGVTGIHGSATASVAGDWAEGSHKRTVVGLQASWSPAPRASVSLYGDADLAGSWDPSRSVTLTSLYGNVRLPLPGGFRFGVGAQTYEPVRQWDAMPADTFTLPGRYTGLTTSLGHDIGGVAVEVSAMALRRAGDPVATMRGTLSLSKGAFYAMASGERGPIADYMYATGRITLTRLSSPVSLALGGLYGLTTFPGSGIDIQRYAVRPDISWRMGRGLLLTLGGDFGQYGGSPSTYLHAGVSYYFH